MSVLERNSNNFSFVHEALNEVNNLDFKEGEHDFLTRNVDGQIDSTYDTSKSYFWTAISAVSNSVSKEIYEKILNYFVDIADIDTCEVKSLQSMLEILGTKYSIFNIINDCPLEIFKLINILSIKPEFLIKDGVLAYDNIQQFRSLTTNKYLHDSSSSCSAYIDELNKNRISDKLSVESVIDSERLKRVIRGIFNDQLSSVVFDTYNDYDHKYIYQQLSNNILYDDFKLNNIYEDDIYELKLKYDIPVTFNTALEADKIEDGLSTLENYNSNEQEILSLEFKNRQLAYANLQPQTRYSYYREKRVKDYFKFIESFFGNNTTSQYYKATKYRLDSNFIEIQRSANAGSKLMKVQGSDLVIDTDMIENVATVLQQITSAIANIREYLKTHAQRTYMKGTFLLLEYAIKEYIQKNIYTALPSLLQKDDNCISSLNVDNVKITLTEYIDHTQYNNIKTDIAEDEFDNTLNQQYWISTTNKGSLDSLDTTNIFKAEHSTQLVDIKSISNTEIQQFYLNVLNNFKTINTSSDKTTSQLLKDFLVSLFEYGAENSYLKDGKVMCELENTCQTSSADEYLKNRQFTIDIEKYLKQLQNSYNDAKYFIEPVEIPDTLTINSQLDYVLNSNIEYATSAYDNQFNELLALFDNYIGETQDSLARLEMLNQQFNNIYLTLQQIIAANASTVTGFSGTATLYKQLYNQFYKYVDSTIEIPHSIRVSILAQCTNILLSYNNIAQNLNRFRETEYYCIYDTKHRTTFDFGYNPYVLRSNINNRFNRKQISDTFNTELIYFENEYDRIHSLLTDSIAALKTQKLIISIEYGQAKQLYFSGLPFNEIYALSVCLSDYYSNTFKLIECVPEISSLLDYSNSEWYKYKTDLFKKYTGQQIGETPYYYLENKKHPSYHIHPCMKNFVEKQNFSYPIDSLAGSSLDVLKHIVKTDNNINIDSQGYLIDIWKNPLNNNSDYLTHYEKTSHIDKDGDLNVVVGYDGPFIPAATTFTEIQN